MTESDQDAVIGKAVREHSEAQKKLELLMEDAKRTAFSFERLANALREPSPAKISDHLSVVLSMFETEKVDWSKLTLESLRGLGVGLKKASSEVASASEKMRKLQV